MSETAQTDGLFVETRFLKRISKTLALVLLLCGTIEIWEAGEEVIRGQVYGLEAAAGAWVGIATGETAYRSYQFVPYDEATIARERNELTNWVFTIDGKFELRSKLEESPHLIVIAKDRIPVSLNIENNRPIQPLHIHLERGLELKGVVRDVNGIAISGATVSMTPLDKIEDIPSFAIPASQTGRNGSFSLAGLEAHGYVLFVTADDYAPVVIPELVIPEIGIDELEIELVQGHYIAGKVINQTGKPVSGLRVSSSWTRSHTEVLGSAGVLKVVRVGQFGWHFPRTRTLEDGTFKLGPFEIATNGSIWADSPEFGSARTRELYAPRNDLRLRLTREKVQGRVLDADTSKPIEKIAVTIFRRSGVAQEVRPNDGFFELPIDPLDSEDTAILVDSQGYFPWIGRLYQGSTGIYDVGNVMLEKERTLQGIVRNGETGKPIEGVHILRNTEQYADKSIRTFLLNWRQRHRAITNEHGEFLIRKLPQGADRLDLISRSHGQQVFDIPSGVAEFDIDLQFNGVIEGSLVLPGGTTVEGEVRLWGSTTLGSRSVDTSEGAFRFDGLPPDTYRLRGDSDAGLIRSRTVVLEAGQRLSDVEIQVRPGWSAKGTITGLKGNESVNITARDRDGRVWNRTWSRNGPYAIHGIPNEAAIVARTSTGLLLIRIFRNGNAGGSTIDFSFENESQLNGSVSSGGEPLGDVFLSIRPSKRGEVIGHTTTTASGSFVVKGLSDGPHTVRTRTGLLFALEINGDTTFDIELPPNSVSGIVRGELTNSPIGGGLARLKSVNVPEAARPIQITERIGSDGTFLFEGLAAGAYEVVVAHGRAEKVSSRIQINGSESIEMLVQCANTQECAEGSLSTR